ncbi:transcriptional regulator [Aspergillus spinulosporus]
MFIPSVHAESDPATLHSFIRANPLGLLITGIRSSSQQFLQCTHVPFVLDTPENTNGVLRAHIAKQNPQAKAMIEHLAERPDILTPEDEVLVDFTAKEHHYVTPKFYVETKPDTGKVVPTWNYATVQVYGKLTLYYDSKSPETGAFLAKQIRDLSEHAESSIMGYTGGERPRPWVVEDAPEKYIEIMQRNIVGIEIRIDQIQGKFKMSQEMKPGDRDGVAAGFSRMASEEGQAMAALVRERGVLHDAKKRNL